MNIMTITYISLKSAKYITIMASRRLLVINEYKDTTYRQFWIFVANWLTATKFFDLAVYFIFLYKVRLPDARYS